MARQLYEKTHEDGWKNLPDETTPVTAESLDHIEQGIYDNSNKMALKEIYGDKNMLLGVGNSATGNDNSLFGSSNTVKGDGNVVSGIGNKIGQKTATDYNLISGKTNELKSGNGGNSISGTYNIVEGSSNSIISGNDNNVKNADASLIFGARNSYLSGSNGLVSGFKNTYSGSYNAVLGLGNKVSGTCSFVRGKYNEEDTNNQYVDIVGGGNSDTERKNIYTLDWQGNAEYTGTVKSAGLILTDTETDQKYMLTIANGNIEITAVE